MCYSADMVRFGDVVYNASTNSFEVFNGEFKAKKKGSTINLGDISLKEDLVLEPDHFGSKTNERKLNEVDEEYRKRCTWEMSSNLNK